MSLLDLLEQLASTNKGTANVLSNQPANIRKAFAENSSEKIAQLISDEKFYACEDHVALI